MKRSINQQLGLGHDTLGRYTLGHHRIGYQRIGTAAAGLVLVGLALTGCQTGQSQVQAKAPDTVVITPVGSVTSAPATQPGLTTAGDPTSATAPTHAAPTTAAPETTAAPSTTTAPPPVTEAPTTTAAPAPTTTLAPIPSNVEEVGPMDAPLVAVGTRGGPNLAAVQLRLMQLGFWNSGANGQWGTTTSQAVMAFQKYIGLPTTSRVDTATAAYLSNYTLKAHGTTNTGTLIEVDKGKQLLFVVVDGKTQWVVNTSTASGKAYSEPDQNHPGQLQAGVAITPDGLFKTYRERPVGWWAGDLGQIYRPKYFSGGTAVHGLSSVPDYPASHGCVRVSPAAMDWIWDNNIMPLGIPVWVHE